MQTAYALKEAHETFAKLGVKVGEPQLDLAAANVWKDGVVKQMTGGVAFLFKAIGVEWVRGTGRFKDATTIAVEGAEDVTLSLARSSPPAHIPMRPPIPGLDSPRCVDSTGLLAQTEVPRRLVVLGGGIIGCEFASIFRQFGSDVAIVEMLDTLIPQEDADATKELAKQFGKRDIALHLGKQCTQVVDDGRQLTVHFGEGEIARGGPHARVGRSRPPRRGHRARTGGDRSSTAALASRQTTGAGHRCRTSTRSATAPAIGSSRTPPSAKARLRLRTRWVMTQP